MIWTSLIVLATIVIATLLLMPESSQQSDTPVDQIENTPEPEIKQTTSTEKSQIMADIEPGQGEMKSGMNSNSTDAVFGMTGVSSSAGASQDVLSKSNNATASQDVLSKSNNATAKEVSGAKVGTDGRVSKSGNVVTASAIASGKAVRTDPLDASHQLLDSTDRTTLEIESDRGAAHVAVVPFIQGAGIATSIESTDIQKTPASGVIIPAAQFAVGNRFEIRVFSSVNKGYRVLSGNGSNEDVVDRINNNETASVNFGYGVQFGWNINRRWTVLTGIAKRTTTINYQFSRQVIYDKAKEIINASGDFENTEDFAFETSNGSITAKTRYAWRLIQDGLKHGDRLDFAFAFDREYHSVVIPLQVQYNIANKAFKFGVIAGAQYARIYQTDVRPGRPNARIRPDQRPVPPLGRDFFTKNTFDVLLADRDLNKNVFEASLGLHFGYQFTELVGVYLQPSYTHGLNNIYTSDNFSTVPTNKQIDAGIILTF